MIQIRIETLQIYHIDLNYWLIHLYQLKCPLLLVTGKTTLKNGLKSEKDSLLCSGSNGKEFTCTEGDLGLIPGLERSPGGGHGDPLQYSCLENPMDRGAWQGTVQEGRKESETTERLNTAQPNLEEWCSDVVVYISAVFLALPFSKRCLFSGSVREFSASIGALFIYQSREKNKGNYPQNFS